MYTHWITTLTHFTANISREMTSVVRLALSVVNEVCLVLEKDAERRGKLHVGLRYIMDEMEMAKTMIKEECRGAEQELRIRRLQEFAYDVEDFVEGLRDPGAYGKVLVAIGADRRLELLTEIEQFKQTIASLTKDWKHCPESSNNMNRHTEDNAISAPNEDEEEEKEEEEEDDLVDIDRPKGKIVELLSPSQGEEQQLRVISIVGCRGVGKTALARAVYRDYSASEEFDCVAWVLASRCNNKRALVDKIFQSVRKALRSKQTENVPAEAERDFAMSLKDILSKKRSVSHPVHFPVLATLLFFCISNIQGILRKLEYFGSKTIFFLDKMISLKRA